MKRLLTLTIIAITTLCVQSVQAQSEYFFQRKSLFEQLPIYKNDIVFLGNSLIDYCEWGELFDNPHIKNRGISGDRAEWIVQRLDPIIKGQPRKLILMIGCNDLAAGSTPDAVVAHIATIFDRFIAESPRTKLYFQSLMPTNGVDYTKHKRHGSKGAEIIEVNRRVKALCEQKGVTFIDIYPTFVDEKGSLRAEYTNEGLHLLGEGYLVWKRAIEKYVK